MSERRSRMCTKGRWQMNEPRPGRGDAPPGSAVFPFRYSGVVGAAARVVASTERRAFVAIDEERGEFIARFGPWVVATGIANIAGARLTGPYAAWKVAGPPHLSFEDRGLTFATNDDAGVCLSFVEPVRGIDPRGWIRHPGLTVTVADPGGLVAAVERSRRAEAGAQLAHGG